jgi:hypothetical protein
MWKSFEDGPLRCDKIHQHSNFRTITAATGDSGIARRACDAEGFRLPVEKYALKAINIRQ